MQSGWVKLHRKMTEWEWYSDQNVSRLFVHLLLTVNHEDTRYKGRVIPRGSRVSGRVKLSEETGLSVQELRTASEKLKSTGEITIKSTSKFSIITICNYDKYQEHRNGGQPANQPASQPTINQPSTTSKEVKKLRSKEKECCDGEESRPSTRTKFIPPTVEEVAAYCKERGNSIDPYRFVDSNTAKGWVVGKSQVPMKDWKAAVRTWEGNGFDKPRPPGPKIDNSEWSKNNCDYGKRGYCSDRDDDYCTTKCQEWVEIKK